MAYDLVIRNARLRDGDLTDIAIADGSYAEIRPGIDEKGREEIDAEESLVTESFVIAQLHLDKVLTGDWVGPDTRKHYMDPTMGGAMTAVEFAGEVKRRYEEGEILERINTALQEAEFAGATHIRAFIDVDTKAQLKGIRAALKARDQWRGRVNIQVVAFPQDGIQRESGAEELLYEAMALGSDLVGGIPWIEYTEADMRAHVNVAFEIAERFDKDVAMLVDDAGDPGLRTTEYLAWKAIDRGWVGRVSGCHARAMTLYNEVYHRKVVALLRRAEMGIVTNPHTGPLHVRVRELADAGVPLALGGESVNDAYYPYGRCNMLEAAFVASHTLWMMSSDDQELLYDMITANPARILRLLQHGIAPGWPANLVVLQARSLREALTTHLEPRYVVRDGRVTCESRRQRIRIRREAGDRDRTRP